jgi:hypothetical protein
MGRRARAPPRAGQGQAIGLPLAPPTPERWRGTARLPRRVTTPQTVHQESDRRKPHFLMLRDSLGTSGVAERLLFWSYPQGLLTIMEVLLYYIQPRELSRSSLMNLLGSAQVDTHLLWPAATDSDSGLAAEWSCFRGGIPERVKAAGRRMAGVGGDSNERRADPRTGRGGQRSMEASMDGPAGAVSWRFETSSSPMGPRCAMLRRCHGKPGAEGLRIPFIAAERPALQLAGPHMMEIAGGIEAGTARHKVPRSPRHALRERRQAPPLGERRDEAAFFRRLASR